MATCEQCRITERNLANAYIRIEQLLNCTRDVDRLNRELSDAQISMTNTRKAVASWLEEQQ